MARADSAPKCQSNVTDNSQCVFFPSHYPQPQFSFAGMEGDDFLPTKLGRHEEAEGALEQQV